MKAKFLALAALLVGMAACQTDPNGLELDRNGEAAVTLNVALPNGATRAAGEDSALGAIDNRIDLENEYDIRFILEVYDEKGELAKDRMVKVGDATEVGFTFRLVPGRDYKFVVWADFVANNSTVETVEDLHYETTNGLRLVAIKDWTAIDESRDAYTAAVDVKDYSGASQIDPITLTRPFAKLRVVTNDIKEMITLRPDIVKVNYFDTKFYTAFDAFAENPIDQSYTGHELIVDLKEDFYKNENPDENGVEKGVKTLFADYFFAKESDRVMFYMDVVFNDGSTLPTVIFNTNIPVDRNKLTTIYGPILTDANNVTVTIDPVFENQLNPNDPPYYVEILSGNMSESIELTKSGSYIFEDLTVNADQAVVVKNGADVVIDIKGYAKLNGKQGIVVEDGATLTINGISKTRTEERAGNLVVVATEGSAIGGNFITINNLAGLTAKAGDAEGAFGIGAINAEVEINNTKIDYVSGAFVQPLFVNDTKYGKSEPEGASAIGGKKVTLDGVELVKAEGGSKAAAIGNRYWSNTEVIIKNSTLKDVFGGNASAAIGGSRVNSDVTAENKLEVKITIENSTIENAVGGQYGAGIGFGYDTHCAANDTNCVNNIVITKSTITAKGGMYAAGIGTGFHTAALTGSIDAESVINATCGEDFYKNTYTTAQNIGYGIVDPEREFKDCNVTFTVAGNVISRPSLPVVGENGTIVEGLGKDIENENQYYASAPEALTYIADQVNEGNGNFNEAKIVLSNDIDLSQFALTRSASNWTPIGTSENPFTGTFNGNGYTIKNFNYVVTGDDEAWYVGLFGYAKNATIKNLVMENVTITSEKAYFAEIGAVVGHLEGTSTLENITIKGDVKVAGNVNNVEASRIGAVVGGNAGGNITIKNVHVNANAGSYVKGGSHVGGIAGQLQVANNFENCSTNIDVTAGRFFAGGIIGCAGNTDVYTNCHSTGNIAVVAGRANNDNDIYRVGGIAGGWDDGATKVCTLVNCSTTCVLVGKSADGRTATAFDCAGFVGRGYSAVVGAKVVVNGAEYEYAGDGIYKMGDAYVVKTGDALVAALAQNYDVTFGGDLKIDPANMSNAYGKTGVLVYNGQTIDGAGYKLDVKGAGGTWDSGICTSGGLIKNIWVTGSFRGVFVKGATHVEKVVLDNVRIEGTTYTISIDQASGQGLEATNSIFRGWTSYAATIGNVKFDGCTFGAGNGYNFSRPYAPTEYVNCTFEAGHQMDPRAAVTFENCTIGGVALTAENLATLVTSNIANASVK